MKKQIALKQFPYSHTEDFYLSLFYCGNKTFLSLSVEWKGEEIILLRVWEYSEKKEKELITKFNSISFNEVVDFWDWNKKIINKLI